MENLTLMMKFMRISYVLVNNLFVAERAYASTEETSKNLA